jgi:predicted ATPase
MGQGGIALWMLGYPDQAVDRIRQGMTLADDLRYPPSVGHALWFAGIVYMMRGDAITAHDLADRLIRLSSEHGLAQYQAVASIIRGWARAQSGELEEGLHELRVSVGSYQATAAPLLAFFILALADTELRAGHLIEADRALQECEKVLRLEPIWSSEFLRLSGDLRIAKNAADWAASEQLYDEALSVARSHNAKSFELRAALSVACMRRQQGRALEGKNLLRPLYSWFTEGLESADLRAAQEVCEMIN